jgi:hypothetical protein
MRLITFLLTLASGSVLAAGLPIRNAAMPGDLDAGLFHSPTLLAVLALAGLSATAPALPAQTGPIPDAVLAREIRDHLVTLPYYGVFDLLSFEVKGGTVRLGGYALHAILREEAEDEVKHLEGVRAIQDGIEILPAGTAEAEVRWAVFRAIYRDPQLVRYGEGRFSPAEGFPARHPWGPGLHNWGLFSRPPWTQAPYFGEEPVGAFAIHIIIKNGRVTLAGVVDSARDRELALSKARQAPGALSVENDLAILADLDSRSSS